MEIIKEKIQSALEKWCVAYKVIGVGFESPRWSQILSKESDEYRYTLQSTVSHIWYEIGLTAEEEKVIDNMQDKQELWNWYKKLRTEYLINNHPTINPY
jgi:hypothetical protein